MSEGVALLGRSEELAQLARLAERPVVITGLPGMGRRSLRAAVSAEVRVGPAPLEGSDEVMLRVGPLSLNAGIELLRARLTDTGADDELRALVARVDGIPMALELCAKLIASRGATKSAKLLARESLLDLTAHDPRAVRWRRELDEARLALPVEVQRLLSDLALFRGSFDELAAGALDHHIGGLQLLIEHGWVISEGSLRIYECIRRYLESAAPAIPESRERYERWVFEEGADPKRRGGVEADLRGLFETGPDATARRAGALLVPLVLDQGPLDPHLQRLVELDRKLADRDLETQCAIAQLHLVLGEPEPAWRRLEAILADAGPWQGRAEHIAANALRRLGRHDEALACYERAIAHFEMAGRRRELGLVLSNLGGLHVERSDAERARRCWSRALRCFAVEGDARAEAVTLGDLGLLDHEAGDLETAERRYRRALELHEELNNRRSVGIVCCDLGELLLTRGSPIEARDVLLRGLEALTSIGDGRQRVLAEAALALAETQTGEDGQARLNIARDRAPDDLSEVMELYAAALRLDQARRARQDGKQDEERAILNAAEELLARVGTTPDEVRRVGRLLRAELERHRRSAGWAIAADASFFLTPEQERIDLSRRHVFRRLLAALLQARLSSPGETLTLEDLLRAGWPGQRVMQAAARNRLHVALSGLRKLGLDPLLQKRRQGYLLDPAIEIYLPDRR